MRRLFIDIETYSSVDLVACGVYPYVESLDFEIMLFAYAWDDGAVQCVRLAEGEKLPRDVVEALVSEDVQKHAYNAMFERVCINTGLVETPISSWHCTQVHAYMAGYSGSLEAVGRAMGLPDDKKKLAHGKALVRYFGRPCARAGANGGRVRNMPHHDREKWQEYIEYCKRDVEAEREIYRRLGNYKIPDVEREVYALDQEINDRGVLIDGELVSRAIDCSERHKERCMMRAREMTGLDNPNSVSQMKRYIKEREGIDIMSLRKGDIDDLMERVIHDDTREVLCLRGELSKTSVKKYRAMQKCMRKDGRAGGLLQHYGASRTGRWAGRLVQVQNLPRNKMTGIHDARKMLHGGDYEAIDILYPSVQDTLSQLVRTAFVAREGCTFAVVDFSAIEARVIAWLSGEAWRMEVFRTHGKIYEASASAMFGVDIKDITKGSVLRQKGKIAELALGYGGGVGALKTMGAIGMGLVDDELQSLVDSWRSANLRIVSLWRCLDKKAKEAVSGGKMRCDMRLPRGITMRKVQGDLRIVLPSSRELSYVGARLDVGRKFGNQVLSYMGKSGAFKAWDRIETYGGKLAENVVQAIARDILAWAMLRLKSAGYDIVMHIHDEVVVEVKEAEADRHLERIIAIMCEDVPWAEWLKLAADGYTTKYYLKD